MPNWFTRLTGRAAAPAERKALQGFVSLSALGEASWSRRGFVSLAGNGFIKNPVVYRCVRMVAEAATRVPLVVEEGGRQLSEHPLLSLLARPNPRIGGAERLEAVYAYLLTAGNAYLEAVTLEGEVKAIYCLRPDRVRVALGRDGHPVGYGYTAGGKTRQLSLDARPVAEVLHLALFHPLDDHYGLAPLEAAAQSLDIHNAAAAWNKALLDNAARPSGALVYSAETGLTEAQFNRLKGELEANFQGAQNAGRPLVLEGGLDWKPMALSPAELDFVELKHQAAREIALAFGVPPQGDDHLVPLAQFQAPTAVTPARLILPRTVDGMPALRERFGIEIDYVAGFGAAIDVPSDLKRGVLALVAHWFEHRDAVLMAGAGAVIPPGFGQMLSPYRQVRLLARRCWGR